MPLTGNQSTFIRPPQYGDMDEEIYIPLSQAIQLLNGNYGAPARFTALNDDTKWAVEIRNFAAGGWGLRVRRGDGLEMLTVSNGLGVVTGVLFKANAGITVPSGGVAVTGDVTVSGNVSTATLNSRGVGNASGNIPVSNGTLNTDLNADKLDGMHAADIIAAVPAYAPVTGSYTGNGTGGGGRNFTLGFQPKMLVITGGTSSATVEEYTSLTTGYSVRKVNSGNTEYSTGVHLLANGFRVSDGNTHGDVLGRNYDYVAFP